MIARLSSTDQRIFLLSIQRGKRSSFFVNNRYNPDCHLLRFTYCKKKELVHHGKVAVAVANRILKIGLVFLYFKFWVLI